MTEYKIVDVRSFEEVGQTSLLHKVGDILTFKASRKVFGFPPHEAYKVISRDSHAKRYLVRPITSLVIPIIDELKEQKGRTESMRVNICGAPSTYKTTVCTALESKLKQDALNAETSKEYARHYIATYGVPVELYEQLIIFENQNTRDLAVAKTNDIMLSDTPAMASYVFGKRMLDAKLVEDAYREPTRAEYKFLEELYMKALKKCYWYDLILLFPPSGQIVQDGVRKETVSDQMDIYNAIVGFLHLNNISYIEVHGTVDDKIQKCYDIIRERMR